MPKLRSDALRMEPIEARSRPQTLEWSSIGREEALEAGLGESRTKVSLFPNITPEFRSDFQ